MTCGTDNFLFYKVLKFPQHTNIITIHLQPSQPYPWPQWLIVMLVYRQKYRKVKKRNNMHIYALLRDKSCMFLHDLSSKRAIIFRNKSLGEFVG